MSANQTTGICPRCQVGLIVGSIIAIEEFRFNRVKRVIPEVIEEVDQTFKKFQREREQEAEKKFKRQREENARYLRDLKRDRFGSEPY